MASTVAVEPTVNGYKVTAHFSRKVSDGNYGGTEAAVWVEGSIGPDATAAEIAFEAARLFMPARTAVYDELGIETQLEEETGLLRESVTPFVSAAQAEQAVNRKFGGSTPVSNNQKAVKVYDYAAKAWVEDHDLPEWVTEPAARLGIDRILRNTKKDDKNYEYYKEAGNNATHGKDGEPYMFWPPKD